jgi:hypothetical protein
MCLRNLILTLLAAGLMVSIPTAAEGQPLAAKTQTPSGDPQAQALVRELLLQRPQQDQRVRCELRLRNADGKRKTVLVQYTTVPGEENWQNIYETTGQPPNEQLIVLHRGVLSTQYIYRADDGTADQKPKVLEGPDANIPFAGSDFWLSDLGLEFLHWPQQRLIRDAKITMRMSRPCKVLESSNPSSNLKEGSYARVESWIDAEFGGLIYAKAYDWKGKLLKVFSLQGFKKVNGTVQVKDMEIRNEQTDSRTKLEFLYD